MKSYKFIISGKVQGVSYRLYTQQNAIKNSFFGYVKNLPNGDVEACVSTTEDRLDEFISILKQGSPNSIVKSIKKLSCNETFTKNFEIRY